MKQILLSMLMLGMFLMLPFSCKRLPENPRERRGLYIYNGKQLSQFFHDVGYPDFWQPQDIFISRNSDGTALRFLHEKKKNSLILTCDGSFQETSIPGFPAWLNDEQHIVAWHDRHTATVHYQTGAREKIVNAFGPDEGPDPSGTYFIKAPLYHSCSTEIYAITSPYQTLINIPVCGPRRIFFKNNQLYLFGIDDEDKPAIREDDKADVTTAHVFQVDRKKFTEVETIKIRRPKSAPTIFPVIDFSPWSDHDDVLFLDVYDLPSRSIWYLFNLQTHEMKKIGTVPSSGGWAFFLQCDILERVRTDFQRKNNK